MDVTLYFEKGLGDFLIGRSSVGHCPDTARRGSADFSQFWPKIDQRLTGNQEGTAQTLQPARLLQKSLADAKIQWCLGRLVGHRYVVAALWPMLYFCSWLCLSFVRLWAFNTDLSFGSIPFWSLSGTSIYIYIYTPNSRVSAHLGGNNIVDSQLIASPATSWERSISTLHGEKCRHLPIQYTAY